MQFNNRSTIGTCKQTEILLLILLKFNSTTSLLLSQFYAITSCDTVSYFFNVSKRVVFERVSSDITPFNIIVELGLSRNYITNVL